MRRLLARAFVRFSRLFGVPEIQGRLDRLDHLLAESVQTLRRDTEIALVQVERRVVEINNANTTDLSSRLSHLEATSELLKADISRVASDIHQVAADLRTTLARVEEVASNGENRLQSLNTALVEYVDGTQKQHATSVESNHAYVTDVIRRVRESVDALRREIESSSMSLVSDSRKTDTTVGVQSTPISDSFYVTLENHFRGSRDLVAERQSNYLKLLPTSISENAPLVDLGCGRGEWLALLSGSGFSAMGVDSNAVCIAECREAGLSVQHADLVDFLRSQADLSIGAYTLFQVLEHLPFGVLVEAIREMRRTLVPGGVLIAEVPNAKNLRVSAGTFWIDPTHQKPLYPELLQFLAAEVGFSKIEGLYVNDQSPQLDLSGLPEGARIAMERVLETIDTAQDFALVATS